MLEDLDSINWSELHHAYGSAADVPQLLRGLTSLDDKEFENCEWSLYGNIYHQGSRYQASAFAVPFLIELVNEPNLRRRERIMKILFYIAFGDDWLDMSDLPFDPNREFSGAEGIVVSKYDDITRDFYGNTNSPDRLEVILNAHDKLKIAWPRDAYFALETHADTVLTWIFDEDIEVARLALSSLPLLPSLHDQLGNTLLNALAANRPMNYTTTVILTIGLIPACINAELRAELTKLMTSFSEVYIQFSAAISLALIYRADTPAEAIRILVNTELGDEGVIRFNSQFAPYHFSLEDFRDLALTRVGK